LTAEAGFASTGLTSSHQQQYRRNLMVAGTVAAIKTYVDARTLDCRAKPRRRDSNAAARQSFRALEVDGPSKIPIVTHSLQKSGNDKPFPIAALFLALVIPDIVLWDRALRPLRLQPCQASANFHHSKSAPTNVGKGDWNFGGIREHRNDLMPVSSRHIFQPGTVVL